MAIKNKSILYILLILLCVAMVLEACTHKEEALVSDDNFTLQLKWNKAYATETKQMAETGFLWTLCFLGAELPKDSFIEGVVWNNNNLQVNFSKLGFSNQNLQALAKLIVQFKQSEEYRKMEAIDLGRFVALTLNSANHYYAITGVAKTFEGFKKGKIFDSKQFVATNSTISTYDRIIDLPDSNNIDYVKDAYISNECDGKVSDGNYTITSFEVFEQMRNGQFRFAIYDSTGLLLSAAKGSAGKPAKCLWCHETTIQTIFVEQKDEPGFYSSEQFKNIVTRNILALKKYRNTLQSDLDFEKKNDHTYTELLYISFMEPNAERLALEWGMSIERVKEKLVGLPTHTHSEFDYLGELYFRDAIDKLAPFASIKAPSSAREKSPYEPDLIK